MTLLTIVGARSQFIKAAVVSRAIAARNQQSDRLVREMILHTGQHYDSNMSAVFFSEMRIPEPTYHLGIAGGSHGTVTGQMLVRIEEVIVAEKPDAVLLYGDTNSTLAGALATAKLAVPVAHVEAGVRSFKRYMPEEINRVLTDHIAELLFAPTDTAVANLRREGLAAHTIHQVGEVMFDAALYYRGIARPTPAIARTLEELSGGFYLATVHRAENTDDESRLKDIMRGLQAVTARTPVVLPLHPRTRKRLGGSKPSSVTLLDPVGYFDMLALLQACSGVLTDSGGLQKEAFFFGKACLVLRDETEWVELVEHGFSALAGVDGDRIAGLANTFFDPTRDFSLPLYGDGRAGERIVELLAGVA